MRLLFTGWLLSSLLVASAWAQPPETEVAQNPPGATNDPSVEQSLIAARYRQLEDLLLRIAQKLERSGNAENIKKARVIQRALRDARDKAIAVNLTQLADSLKKPGLADLKKAVEQGSAVRVDLEQLLLALLSDDESNQDKVKQLQALIKELEAALRAQKIANAKNQSPSVEPQDAAEAQEIARKQSERVLAKLGDPNKKAGDPKDAKQGDPKDAKEGDGKDSKEGKDSKGKPNQGKEGKDQKGKDGKPNDGKQNDGKPKPGDSKEKKPGDQKDAKPGDQKDKKPGDQQDSKPSDPKDAKPSDPKDSKPSEGESKDGKQKDSKDSKPSQGQPQEGGDQNDSESQQQQQQQEQEPQDEQSQARKRVKEANDHQKKARDDIEKNKRDKATQEQEEATRKLEEAKKRLEEILKQMREEEIERVLADLQRRCEALLQMQEIVFENTKRVHGKIQANSGHQPSREEEIICKRLGEDEDKIIVEADKAIAVMEAEGSAVAMLETMRQVRSDMGQVSRRLGRINPGPETQLVEEDIIATLKDMIEAFKKQQKEQREKKNQQQQQNGQPPPQALLDKLAELRMIKALQLRVNTRTKLWAQRYQGEEAADPEIVTELRDLSQRQEKIQEMTENLAKGRNQ